MINDNVDRGAVIQRLTELATTRLKTDLDLVEEVFAYIPVNPESISPYIAFQPGGSDRSRDDRQVAFLVFAHIYVIFAKENVVAESDAWQALDQIEKAFAEFVKSVHRSDIWFDISWAEYSNIIVAPADNQGYLIEMIPLVIQSF